MQRLDAAELTGERVPVKGDASDAGSHYYRFADPGELQVCPSPVRFQSFWNLVSIFFSFPEFEWPMLQAHLRIRRWARLSAFVFRPRDILSRGSPCPTRYHLNPRGMAAITRGVDKVTVAGSGTTTSYVKSSQAWLASHTTQDC